MTTWLYWFPDRGETGEDAKKMESSTDPELAAADIAEKDWHRSDYWDEETIVIKSDGWLSRFVVEVESLPHFRVRRL